MAWIKIEIGLDSRREVVLIASVLQTDRRTTVGHLVAFWSWADGETTDGRLVGMTPALIDEIIQVPGFADALLDDQVGWLLRYEGGLELPKYEKHHSQAAKTRALDTSRKSSSRRDPVRIDNGQSTDQIREEKRREENTKTPPTSSNKSKRQQKFTPPTVEEVRAHCLKRHSTVDPEKFVAHYESNGWMVGKNRMKKWESAIITWEKSNVDSPRSGQTTRLSRVEAEPGKYDGIGPSS